MTNLRNIATWYRGNLDWLPARTIFLTKHGSQAYGTALPTSDVDVKGVAIPPREYFLGFLHRFEQAEVREPIDAVIFDVRKFFALAADCNPNIIEVLFTDESDWLISTPPWVRIAEQRALFLSTRARHTFSGYAMSQLKRIESHRRWLLDPPKAQPKRSDFGLPEQTTIPRDQLQAADAQVRKRLDALGGLGLSKDEQEQHVADAGRGIGFDDNFIEALIRERRYGAAARNWQQYQTWKAERNAARAELEAKHGYDTKHAMHLVRLLRMGREILSGAGVLVRRPDAEELLDIRRGAWTYDQLIAWARAAEAEVAGAESPLPREPDRAALDGLLVGVVAAYLGEGSA